MKSVPICALAVLVMAGITCRADAQQGVVICIDPGHPSEVNSGYTMQNGTTETHVNWEVATRLQALLQAKGFTVVMTKHAEKETVKNRERAMIANRAHASLMIRLHCDAGTSTGYALYYPDRQGTTQGKTGPSPDMITASHKAADYLLEGIKPVLQPYLTCGGVRGDSKTLVGSRQGALTGSIFSQVPAVTMEMVVLSNAKDAAFAKSTKGPDVIAQAIASGIANYAASALLPNHRTGR
jgi:N-acetylmuramoyl-L-alanine amidase